MLDTKKVVKSWSFSDRPRSPSQSEAILKIQQSIRLSQIEHHLLRQRMSKQPISRATNLDLALGHLGPRIDECPRKFKPTSKEPLEAGPKFTATSMNLSNFKLRQVEQSFFFFFFFTATWWSLVAWNKQSENLAGRSQNHAQNDLISPVPEFLQWKMTDVGCNFF